MDLIATFDILEEANEVSNKLPEVQFKPSEIAYITGTNIGTKTFFAQFCRYSQLELELYNKQVQEECKKHIAKLYANSLEIGNLDLGQVVCARYLRDQLWYRAFVINKFEDEKNCRVMFIDYGNIEIVKVQDLLVIDSPLINREPFGVACHYKAGRKFSEKEWRRFLKRILDKYICVKPTDRVSKYLYEVDIPLHYGYNLDFLSKFRPEQFGVLGTEYRPGGKKLKQFDRTDANQTDNGSSSEPNVFHARVKKEPISSIQFKVELSTIKNEPSSN